MSLKNICINKIKAQLVERDNEIAQLKARTKERGVAASDKFEDHIEELHSKRKEVRRKMEAFQEARDNAWVYLEEDVDNALKELRKALNKAISQI